MVRTQLYLPDDLYKMLKQKAKLKNMTFASYVRVHLEKDARPKVMTDEEFNKAFPFVKVAGSMLRGKLSGKTLTNEEIDKFVYGL